MKFTNLKDDLKECKRGVYLLEGDDAYFRQSGEAQIKEKFLKFPELNFSSLEGESIVGSKLSSLVDSLSVFPFMGEYRIVRISEFYPSESDYNKYLKNLFENFPQSSILLIVNKDSKKGCDLKRKSGVAYFDCNQADEETVTRWIYLTLKKAHVSSSVDVCAVVARYCLCNMSRVAIEVEKIIDYKGGDESPLTREEVDGLVYKDADFRMYEMTEAISRRDFTKYLEVQQEFCKKSGDCTAVLSSLFSYFKNLLTVLTSDKTDGELSELLKMKEYGVKKSREKAYALGEAKLKNYVQSCYAAISDIKNGRQSEESALLGVNNLIFFS